MFKKLLRSADYVFRYGGEEFLIANADKALYRAKQNGRNCVEVFNNESDAEQVA